MTPKILVDLDNTLNDFQYHFVDTVINLGYNYNLNALRKYNIELGIDVPSQQEKESIMDYIFKQETFWLTIPLQENAYNGAKFLFDNYDTRIATVPWRFTQKYKDLKISWLGSNLPFISPSKVIFSKEKETLGGNVIIEDKPSTLQKCKEKGLITIGKWWPYNQGVNYDYQLNDWNDISIIMKDIETL